MCVRWVPGRPRPSFGENAAAPAASLSLWEQRVSRRGRGPPAGAEGAARTVPPARPLHGHSPTAQAPQGTALPPAPWSRREDVEPSRDPGFLKRAQALGPRGGSASPVQIRASHSVLVPVLCADATARRAAARSLSRGAGGKPAEGADSPATCFPVLVAAVLVFKAGPTRRGARGKRHVRGRVLREQPSGDPWEHMGGAGRWAGARGGHSVSVPCRRGPPRALGSAARGGAPSGGSNLLSLCPARVGHRAHLLRKWAYFLLKFDDPNWALYVSMSTERGKNTFKVAK